MVLGYLDGSIVRRLSEAELEDRDERRRTLDACIELYRLKVCMLDYFGPLTETAYE